MKQLVFILWLVPIAVLAQKNHVTGNSTVTNARFKIIQDSIMHQIDKGIIPSFSVAVSEKGKIIWQQSFGWADKENKIRATPQTPYALASLSKSITVTALMTLIQKGMIDADAPADQYLGKSKLTYFKGDPSKLNVSELTNMMAGIPHQYEYFYTGEKKQPLSIEEQIKRYGIVVFTPGQVFNYSNFSPAIAEQIIQHVSGKNLAAYMQEAVFAPLGMRHAAVYRNDLSNPAVAKGYNAGHLLPASEFYPKGGAGYYASVSDLIRYGMFHLKDKLSATTPILNDNNLDKLHLPQYIPFYANGWGVLKIINGKTSLLSNGAIDGAASSLLLLPEQDIAIACLTNATVGNDFTDQFAYSIANVLLPGYRRDLEQFIEANAPMFTDKPFSTSDSLLGTWEGQIITYRDSIPVQLVFDSGNKVFIHIRDQFETMLNKVTINDGIIHAQCFGHLSLPETEGIPHYLELALKPGHEELYGSISAESFFTQRPYFLIPAYIWVKKVKAINK